MIPFSAVSAVYKILYAFPKYFFPQQMADSVMDIDYNKFWDEGIRGLIFDIDNTLATFDIALPDEATVAFLRSLEEKGFSICFLSNNSKRRVEIFSESLGYPHIWRAQKPRRVNLYKAIKMLGLDKSQVVLIGDQIFTDCLSGNRAGVYTVLTAPISVKDEWQVKLKRLPEKFVLRAIRRAKL
ncbi:MAG: YqeG family HAD IIIA-type phosphatase [Defluviitaleaceae bacterium]|nr:YqeG family HAD IIIA-type phosphatase [Defluviitaleaceae bacterium]